MVTDKAQMLPQPQTPTTPKDEAYSSKPIRVARQRAIAPMTEPTVMLTCRGAGMLRVDTHPNLLRRRSVLMAKGIAEVLPDEVFHVLMSSVSEERPKFQRK